MKPRQFLPQKLDIKAFIESQMPMDGASPLSELPRLGDSLSPEISLDTLPPIPWRAQGRLVPQRVGSPQLWLDLSAHAELPWSCQRCLHPVILPVSFDRQIHFVADEAVAVELDAELDEDVLVLSRSFDLLSLIEDELIMASPLVPRHESCPVEPVMAVSDPGVDGDDEPSDVDGSTGEPGEAREGDAPRSKRPNPFAVLAKLKKGGSDQGGDA